MTPLAVPSSERRTSALQYVETARDLAVRILGFSNRFPKRLANRLTNPLCSHATEALYHVQAANRIFVRSDYDFDRRRGHLQEALGHIDHVASLLDVCYEMQVTDDALRDPNDNVYTQLAKAIDRERSLIGGVMRRDRDARR